jgi:hypothetical protein
VSGKVEWLPVADLLDADPEPVSWLCEPLLARGAVTILCGPFGVGKSLFAIAAGSAIAHGAQRLGGMRVRPGKVIVIDAENGRRVLHQRAHLAQLPRRACGSASAAASTFAPPKAAASCAQPSRSPAPPC